MKLKITSIIMAIVLITGLLGGSVCLADERYTASTPLTSASSGNIQNIRRAASAINGIRIESGESFSFNEIVGPRTKAQGYVNGENARGISVTGGGVAQVATTLYLALMRMGGRVEFTDLATYGSRFEGDYVADGTMAVITDYSGGTDFAFINHVDPMTIEMWVSETALNCVVTLDTPESDIYNKAFGVWSNTPTPSPVPVRTVSARIPLDGDDGTLENVRLAAKSINGTRLASGEVFSFNEIVGPRTKKKGYEGGINGRGAKVTGGGVAQVASVVWLTVKQMDDVSIIEKSTYGSRYNQEYVESSADAIVTDYQSKKDFSFRYNGAGAITIYTAIEGDTLRCDIAYQ